MFHVSRRARGSAMVLVMVILAVLALMGAAALTLTQQESVTVNRSISYNTLVACADAAEKKLWAEYALYGNRNTPSMPTVVPGTNQMLSIGHFDAEDGGSGTITSVTWDNSMIQLGSNAISGGVQEIDQSNTFRSSLLGQPYLITAHCSDSTGRQYEVELLVRFGL